MRRRPERHHPLLARQDSAFSSTPWLPLSTSISCCAPGPCLTIPQSLLLRADEVIESSSQWKETEVAGRVLGISLQSVEVPGAEQLERAFAEITRGRPTALLVLGDPWIFSQGRRIVELAAKHRLPTIYDLREYVDSGGLMSYGPSLRGTFRLAAFYVDKILKGAKPADLPIEQPTKFDFVINLETAKALGLTIPQSLLLRADEVIQ